MRLLWIMLAVLLLAGCKSQPVPPRVFDRPDAAPVTGALAERDVRVTTAADRIDAAVAAVPEVKARVEPETVEIRAAVASAPAEDVSALIKTFESQLDNREREIARLEAQNQKLLDRELVFQARGLTGLGIALVLAFGVSVAFGGGLVAAAKTWPIAVMGVGCLGLAQIVAHPWFMPSMAGLLALALGYTIYYVYDRHREGRLKGSLEKKAALLRKIVPVLDDAYEHGAETMREVLDHGVFDKLSKQLNREEKALVHEVRKEVQEVGA